MREDRGRSSRRIYVEIALPWLSGPMSHSSSQTLLLAGTGKRAWEAFVRVSRGLATQPRAMGHAPKQLRIMPAYLWLSRGRKGARIRNITVV